MKILFAGSMGWDDEASVHKVLDDIAGDQPVHLVLAYDVRGADLFAHQWAGERAKHRRTFIDVYRASKSFGQVRGEWVSRRDEYMVNLGGYDVAVICQRRAKTNGEKASQRALRVAQLAEQAGIDVALYNYEETATNPTRRKR